MSFVIIVNYLSLFPYIIYVSFIILHKASIPLLYKKNSFSVTIQKFQT